MIISTGFIIFLIFTLMRLSLGIFSSALITVLLIVLAVYLPIEVSRNEESEVEGSDRVTNIVKCPACGNFIDIKGRNRGETFKCPYCGRLLKMS